MYSLSNSILFWTEKALFLRRILEIVEKNRNNLATRNSLSLSSGVCYWSSSSIKHFFEVFSESNERFCLCLPQVNGFYLVFCAFFTKCKFLFSWKKFYRVFDKVFISVMSSVLSEKVFAWKWKTSHMPFVSTRKVFHSFHEVQRDF